LVKKLTSRNYSIFIYQAFGSDIACNIKALKKLEPGLWDGHKKVENFPPVQLDKVKQPSPARELA
jgi:hypothetical protein